MASEIASAYVSLIPSFRGGAAAIQREMGRDLVKAGRKGGEEYGKGFADTAVDEAGGKKVTSGISDKLKLGLAAGGAIAGAALVSGIGEALERGKLESKLAAQLGGGRQTKRATRAASDLFAGAWGDSVDEVNTAVASVVTNIGGMRKASERHLEGITASVLDIATAFDQDAQAITRTVDQMVRTDMAKGPKQALDVITRGFQSGANEADDLLDTFNEYGTQFRKLGFDGPQALGLLTQGLRSGARDADVVADAFKEFSIRAVDDSKLTKDSFDALGLSAGDMEDRIAKGGKSASDATALVLDKLRKVKDPADRAQIAVGLFGTQSEDLGDALFKLDPTNAVDTLTQFKRTMQTRFVNFLGNEVIPAAEDLWRDVGPDVKRFGRQLANMGEDIGPVVKDTLPIFANVLGDVAGAVGGFATAFNKLPGPVQTALISGGLFALLRGRGGGVGGGIGGALPLLTMPGRRGAPTPTTSTPGRTRGGGVGTAALLALMGGSPLGGGNPLLKTGAYGAAGFRVGGPIGALLGGSYGLYTSQLATGKKFTEDPTIKRAQVAAREWKGATTQISHSIHTLSVESDKLDVQLLNITKRNPERGLKLFQQIADESGLELEDLNELLPTASRRLDKLGGEQAADGVRSLTGAVTATAVQMTRKLIPSSKDLADKFDLNRREARNLREALADTTTTGKAHDRQLEKVADQLGLNKDQTRKLIKEYGDVPKKVETDAIFRTGDAARARDSFLRQTKGAFSDLGNDTYAIMVNGTSGHGRLFEADGDILNGHSAQIAKPGTTRVWNEPETGGEAYIPLATSKRSRSLDIWAQTGRELGVQGFADGGIAGRVNTKVNMDLSVLRAVVEQTVKALQVAGASGGLTPQQVARGQAFARAQLGKPYVWAGAGPGGYDCSGFQAATFNAARGMANPYSRLGSTGTMPWPQMREGKGGAFRVGWFTGNPGHTAGTIGGLNIESRGGDGVVVGGNARGADDPLFNRHGYFVTAAGRRFQVTSGRGDPANAAAGGPLNQYERYIVDHESGGRVNANNPSSTAFGIGQLTTANRVRYAGQLGFGAAGERGDTGTTDRDQQLAMMRSYIKDRYGSSRAAYNWHVNHGWYDQGGILKPGWTAAYNGTGQNEYVTKEPPPRRAGVQRFVLDAGGGRTLTGWIDDGVDANNEFAATTSRMRR